MTDGGAQSGLFPGDGGVQTRRIIVLGSTGSIGTQTLDVIARLNTLADRGASPVRYEVVALAGGRNASLLATQAKRFGVRALALADTDAAIPEGMTVHRGLDAAEHLVRSVDAEVVLGAIVGSAGLPATLAAVELGRTVALANKETLVAAGALVVAAAARSGAAILPVDSEHAGVWQCLVPSSRGAGDGTRRGAPPYARLPEVRRVVLTASGGPFRERSRADIAHATRDEALAHPIWTMGAKVTIDSATLMNKALELIEAHWLFGLKSDQLDAVIHPRSIIHALVERCDGSVLAQLGTPNMSSPIQAALTFPYWAPPSVPALDLTALGTLELLPIDPARFPAIGHARRAMDMGGIAGAVLTAANERAVNAFLAGAIPFGRIDELAGETLEAVGIGPLRTLTDAMDAEQLAHNDIDERIARTT